MASDDEDQHSPFLKPGFLVAAVIVALVVVAGVVLGIVNATQDEPESNAATPPPSISSAVPTPTQAAAKGEESVCDLPGEVLSGTVSVSPDASWEYQDTIAFPVSAEFGPGETSSDAVRYCFQRSPEGALFAAANGLVQGSGSASAAWINYFLADDALNRQELVEEVGAGAPPDARLNLEGFKVLSYDGSAARIDLAARGTGSGQSVYVSVVYDLVWQDGDWKLSPQNSSNPLRMAQIPDLAGYVTWRE